MKRVPLKIWIEAFRLRTLPLAISAALMGSLLALDAGGFLFPVCLFAILTSLLLQILSNVANDYGDGMKGTDDERQGPRRVLQAGLVSPGQMRGMIIFLASLSLISGIALIYFGLREAPIRSILIFLTMGLAAIAAALYYTMGKKPYGYVGLGDLMVFIFFGLVGVAGTYYLHTGVLPADILLPASALGFLSAGVLNLNNLRDHKSDIESGKNTLVVRLGLRGGRIYHSLLLAGAMTLTLLWVLLNYDSPFQLLFLLILPLLYRNLRAVWTSTDPVELVGALKQLSLTTFLFSLIFGIGLLI